MSEFTSALTQWLQQQQQQGQQQLCLHIMNTWFDLINLINIFRFIFIMYVCATNSPPRYCQQWAPPSSWLICVALKVALAGWQVGWLTGWLFCICWNVFKSLCRVDLLNTITLKCLKGTKQKQQQKLLFKFMETSEETFYMFNYFC